jgi:hypothetical protein
MEVRMAHTARLALVTLAVLGIHCGGGEDIGEPAPPAGAPDDAAGVVDSSQSPDGAQVDGRDAQLDRDVSADPAADPPPADSAKETDAGQPSDADDGSTGDAPDALSEEQSDAAFETSDAEASPEASADAVGEQLPPTCSLCHGSGANPAPPRDLGGHLDTASPGVGAHQEHLATSSWHHTLECSECHAVPTQPVYDPLVPTHMNGADDVRWGPIAKFGTYDAVAYTCTGTHCHGGTLLPDAPGATSIRVPIWNKVDGTQKACGTSCHTLPPGGSHPSDLQCPSCHGQVVSSFAPGSPPSVGWADASLHVNGTVQVSGSCSSCHSKPQGAQGERRAIVGPGADFSLA